MAQPLPPTEQASQHFQRGVELLNQRDQKAALAEFRAAQSLSPNLTTLWNIVVIEVELGLHLDAHRDLLAYLDLAGSDVPADRLQVAIDTRRTLERELGRLRVNVDALGAVVKVDGTLVDGWTWLAPGAHTVTAEAPDRQPVSRVVILERGLAKEVELSLPAKTAPSAKPQATQTVPKAPATPPGEATGESDERQRTVGYVIGGAGVAALAVGGVFGIKAIVNGNEAASHCVGKLCDDQGLALYDQGKTAANVANIMIGAGVLATGLGVALVLSSGSSAPYRSHKVAKSARYTIFVASPGQGAIMYVQGGF